MSTIVSYAPDVCNGKGREELGASDCHWFWPITGLGSKQVLYRALANSASEMRERNNTVARTELLDAKPMVMKERAPRSTLTVSRHVGQLIFSFRACQEVETLIAVDWRDKVGLSNAKRSKVCDL